MKDNAKSKSRKYFNGHRKSKLAHVGYWRHDYKYALAETEKIRPDRLIDIGCGPGAFLCLVEEAYPGIQLNALELFAERSGVVVSEEMQATIEAQMEVFPTPGGPQNIIEEI